jgi:hypothetical protein
MTQLCGKCSRPNPDEARYCYFDGAALRSDNGASGPVRLGTQPFPSRFVFPSGQVCHNFDQLALACWQDPQAALDSLKQGDLANFLGGMGRSDLAAAAREAARSAARVRGLDTFLGKLPTTVLKPPQLRVAPAEVHLGTLRPGEERRLDVTLANQGMRLLTGTASCDDCVWLSLDDATGTRQKMLQVSGEATLPVFVLGKRLAARPQPYEGRVVIESNGGSATVVVRAEAPVRPFPAGVLAGALSPRQVAEKAHAHPREAAAFFENGAVAQWYRDNGWTYPVKGPSSSGLAAIQQFFEALGLAKPPRVEISEQQVVLRGKVGESLRHQLEVRTREARAVYALAASSQPWLTVECPAPKGRVAPVCLVVPSVPNYPGESLQARVTVRANGDQRFVVSVFLAISEGRAVGGPSLPPDVLSVEPGPASPGLAPAATPLGDHGLPATAAVPGESTDGETTPRRGWLWHLLPAGVLLLILFAMLVRDIFTTGGPPAVLVDAEGEVRLVSTEPRLAVRFHASREDLNDHKMAPETMRFGLLTRDPNNPNQSKRLTWDERGRSNNTCLHIDGTDCLFGQPPGSWVDRGTHLENDLKNMRWDGMRSVWAYQDVQVTQTVEIVPGQISHLLDTCLVRYRIENRGRLARRVGLRFMLDTYIGANDGVPFLLPGAKGLCNTYHDFRTPREVPDFIQALEFDNLANPGTVALVQFRLGGRLEPPARVTLGAWPDTRLRQLGDDRIEAQETKWDVPVLSMRSIKEVDPRAGADSAVVLYWPERPLLPGASREVGFAYGLGDVAAGEGGGKLGLSVGGSLTVGAEFTVTALVSNPEPGQRLILELPSGLQLKEGTRDQPVPRPENTGSRNSPVTWRVQALQRGDHQIKVRSSTGTGQNKIVTIAQRSIFD